MLHFDSLRYIAVENIVRKGEIACNKQFFLFSQCFLTYMVLIFCFKCTLKCRMIFVSTWTSLKFCCLVWVKVVLNTIQSILLPVLHDILHKPLAAFPHNHYRNNVKMKARLKYCGHDYHQSSERNWPSQGTNQHPQFSSSVCYQLCYQGSASAYLKPT